MTNNAHNINLADYSKAELEAMRGLFHDAVRRNRRKVVLAYVGFVSAQETLEAIDARLAEYPVDEEQAS